MLNRDMKNTHLIASANTTNGFAIGITASESKGTQPGTYFSVIRLNRQSKYVTLSTHRSEAEARKAANVAYKGDTARKEG